MADREVDSTGKDDDGDISSLCGTGTWSPRAKADAIDDIEGGSHTYYVSWSDVEPTKIHVVDGPTGKYLRTDRDDTARNNLLDLPDC